LNPSTKKFDTQQRGFALLLTLLLLSLMVVLVFSVSNRSTLDARELNFKIQSTQQQELIKSCINICTAWLKQPHTNTEFNFELRGNLVHVRCEFFKDSFDINDLSGNYTKETINRLNEALNITNLKAYRQNIIDLVQDTPSPWINREAFLDTLGIDPDETSPILNVLPHDSAKVTLSIEMLNTHRLEQVVFFFPSPSGLKPVCSVELHENL
jgi:type II secretory pathway component PulK